MDSIVPHLAFFANNFLKQNTSVDYYHIIFLFKNQISVFKNQSSTFENHLTVWLNNILYYTILSSTTIPMDNLYFKMHYKIFLGLNRTFRYLFIYFYFCIPNKWINFTNRKLKLLFLSLLVTTAYWEFSQ